jgi:hypothetical protein
MVAGRRNTVALWLALSIAAIASCSSNTVNKSSGDLKSCAKEEVCVETAPEFWTGPVAIAVGAIDEPPTCTGSYSKQEAEAFDGLVGEPATCEGCSCGAATASCAPAAVTIKGPSCFAGCENEYSVEPNVCQSATSCAVPGPLGIAELTAGPGSGTCVPSGPTSEEVPDAEWTDKLVACSGTTGAACGTGSVCAPAPPAGFSATLCILRAGEHSCPPPYTTQQIVHETFSDDRSCACSCEPATGVTCNGSVGFWDSSTGCAGPAKAAYATGTVDTCVTTMSFQMLSINYTVTPTGGQCEPSLDPAVGAATPESPITICCLP